jgi:hypothetical protein
MKTRLWLTIFLALPFCGCVFAGQPRSELFFMLPDTASPAAEVKEKNPPLAARLEALPTISQTERLISQTYSK